MPGLRARVAFAGSALRVLAAPLSLLTLLVCCVRSEDAEVWYMQIPEHLMVRSAEKVRGLK